MEQCIIGLALLLLQTPESQQKSVLSLGKARERGIHALKIVSLFLHVYENKHCIPLKLDWVMKCFFRSRIFPEFKK